MSKGFLDYLRKGALFKNDYVENCYHSFSEVDLQSELDLYRGYCLEYASEQAVDASEVSVFAESFNAFMPEESLLKQFALYVDRVIINDPVFVHSVAPNELAEAMNLFLEMPESGIDRERISRAAAYMNRLSPAVRAGFVEFLPISYHYEPPEQIPLTYSANGYADALPEEISEWFRAAAEVYPMEKGKKGWCIRDDKPLEPCRAISVNFQDSLSPADSIFFLSSLTVLSFDEDIGIAEFAQEMPDTPPDPEQFYAWVFQSINQASRHLFDRVVTELSIAQRIHSTYLTRSPFVAELLSRAWYQQPDLETDLTNAVLQLELPILEDISLERVINLRQKDGEAFRNFRIDLARHLRELRRITDSEELIARMQNVSHELCEVQVNEVKNKIAKIKRGMFADALIFFGGLTVTIQNQGLGIPALIYALQKGYKTYNEYISDVKENPAFFLWKLLS